MTIGRQIRAARGLLKWSGLVLAEKAGLTRETINQIEADAVQPREGTLSDILRVFEEHGVEFIGDRGVAFRDDFLRLIEGEDCYLKFLDGLYHSAKRLKGEILFFCVDDRLSSQEVIDANKRIRKTGIRCRYICEQGNPRHDYPLAEYRAIPSKYFRNGVQVIYDDRVATYMRDEEKVLVVRNKELADTQRALFELVWSSYPAPKGERHA